MSQTNTEGADLGSILGKLEVILGEYLEEKAPQFPKEWKEMLVKFAPYLAIVGVISGVAGFLDLLKLGIRTGQPFLGFGYILNIVFLGIILLFLGLAVPGLFSRSKKAWNFLYWGTLVWAVQNIVVFDIAGLIIGTLLSLYFLFQVREYYK